MPELSMFTLLSLLTKIFGKSGPALELLKIYGLDADNIVNKAKIALAAKK